MFRAKIQVKQNDKTKCEDIFSDTTKEELFVKVINYFHGYISAMSDFTKMTIEYPTQISLDGYRAWSNGSGYTIQIVNENGQIITTANDII